MKRIPVELRPGTPSIYIAGPDVFYQDAALRQSKASDMAHQLGFFALNPMDNDIDHAREPKQVSRDIFRANKAMIEQCDYVVANLEAFRGLEPDSGTVWEIGYAIGIGKKVIGYRKDTRPMIEQVGVCTSDSNINSKPVDKNGHTIENFGNALNLMIQESIECLVTGSLEDALLKIKEIELSRQRKVTPNNKLMANAI